MPASTSALVIGIRFTASEPDTVSCQIYSYFVSCDKESEMINVDVDKINTMKNVFRNELTEKEIDDMKESVKKHEFVKIIKPFIISKARF